MHKNYANMQTVLVEYAAINMHEICQKHAYVCNKYAINMRLYAKICKKMQIYRLYQSNMQSTCKKYATNMHKYANNIVISINMH